MSLQPEFSLTVWNGFLLVISLIVIRFAPPALIDRDSLPRLDYFPPVVGFKRISLRVYLVTNTILLIYPTRCFSRLNRAPGFFSRASSFTCWGSPVMPWP
ncbi:MAG: hypothetical protein AB1767_00155 [Bacillota bacterium]